MALDANNIYRKQVQLLVRVLPLVDTEKCFVRKTGMKYHVDLHIIVDANLTVRDGHHLAHILKDYLKSEFIQLADVHIHVEPND